MTDHSNDTEQAPDTPCEHCGIFTLGGDIPIQGAWRDITYVPVRDNIWSVSEGIYRTIFLKGQKGVVAFDTLTTPGTARAYAAAAGRVYPNNPIHTIIYSHDHLDHTGGVPDEEEVNPSEVATGCHPTGQPDDSRRPDTPGPVD